MYEVGWMVEMLKVLMYVWVKILELYVVMGLLEFVKKFFNEVKVCVLLGIGFGDYGDMYVCFVLIENCDCIC